MAAKPHLKTTFIRKNQCISPSPARYGATSKLSSRNEPTQPIPERTTLKKGAHTFIEPNWIPIYRPNPEISYLFPPISVPSCFFLPPDLTIGPVPLRPSALDSSTPEQRVFLPHSHFRTANALQCLGYVQSTLSRSTYRPNSPTPKNRLDSKSVLKSELNECRPLKC